VDAGPNAAWDGTPMVQEFSEEELTQQHNGGKERRFFQRNSY
jgi:hypothetical protein